MMKTFEPKQISLPWRLPDAVKCCTVLYGVEVDPDVFAQQTRIIPEHSLEGAVASRRLEYYQGRYCAKKAMSWSDDRWFHLTRAGDRQPQWPQDMVGSISHTRLQCGSQGFAGALVADRKVMRAVAFDAESVIAEQRVQGIRKQVCHQADRGASDFQEAVWTTIVFSAKESVYKLLYPLCEKKFWFGDAAVTVRPDYSWKAELLIELNDALPQGFVVEGRWCHDDRGLIYTSCYLANNSQSYH
tara:strand:+ start:906 stop:1634 length:729 start_codon:yes stop_codon:yes gene_type:complete